MPSGLAHNTTAHEVGRLLNERKARERSTVESGSSPWMPAKIRISTALLAGRQTWSGAFATECPYTEGFVANAPRLLIGLAMALS